MTDSHINITESQIVGVYMNGVQGSNYGNQNWVVYFNGQRGYSVRLTGQAGKTGQNFHAVSITGSGDLHIQIYALDDNPQGLDQFVFNFAQFTYY